MFRRRPTRLLLSAAVLLTLVLATALPGQGQEIPSLDDLPTLDDLVGELGDIEGLDPLDPVLGEVTTVIQTLTSQITDVLADVPVLNALALQGEDAIDAAVAFSQATFGEGATTAILSREDLFADAFSSGAFQGVNDAPLLLTDSDDLDPRTGLELQRLGMDAITILGGETALHPLVVQKLEIAGLDVNRVGGPTRVETSVEAAQAILPAATTAVLVRAYPDAGMPDSQAYADLLAAGPFAAENGWPILMTTSDVLHGAVAEHLDNGVIENVIIVGGTGAVSQAVEDSVTALGLGVARISGDNRYATAVAIANARGFGSSADADQIVLAESGSRDDVWAPGFASTAYGDANNAPVLLTDGATIPTETLEFITAGLADVPVGPLVDDLLGGVDLLDGVTDLLPGTDALGVRQLGAPDVTDVLDGLDGIVPELDDVLGQVPGGDVLGEVLGDVVLGDLLTDITDVTTVTDLAGNLLDGGSAVICASFVDPVACNAVALLMIGDLAGASQLIDNLLTTILTLPFIGELLTQLGLAELLPANLQALVDQLLGLGVEDITDLLGAIAAGDLGVVEDLLTDVLGGVLGEAAIPGLEDLDLDQLLGGLLGGGAGLPTEDNPLGGIIDDVLAGDPDLIDPDIIDDVLGGVTGGLLGGGSGDGSGDAGSGDGSGDGGSGDGGGIGDLVDDLIGGGGGLLGG